MSLIISSFVFCLWFNFKGIEWHKHTQMQCLACNHLVGCRIFFKRQDSSFIFFSKFKKKDNCLDNRYLILCFVCTFSWLFLETLLLEFSLFFFLSPQICLLLIFTVDFSISSYVCCFPKWRHLLSSWGIISYKYDLRNYYQQEYAWVCARWTNKNT